MIHTKQNGCIEVLWNDTAIEHLSDYTVWTDELRLLLEKRCRHLESLDVEPTNLSVIWFWEWFQHCPADCLYLPLLRLMPGIYAHGRWQTDAELLEKCGVPPGRIIAPDGSVIFTHGERAVLWNPNGNIKASIVDNVYPTNSGWHHSLAEIDYHPAWLGQKPFLGISYATYHNVTAYLSQLHPGMEAEDFVNQILILF